MSWICLRCEGLILPASSSTCPSCHFNLQNIQHFLGPFLPFGGFQIKLKNALTELHASRLKRDDFNRRLHIERELTLVYLERYRHLMGESGHPLISALETYQKALSALPGQNQEDEKKALLLAHEADDALIKLERLPIPTA